MTPHSSYTVSAPQKDAWIGVTLSPHAKQLIRSILEHEAEFLYRLFALAAAAVPRCIEFVNPYPADPPSRRLPFLFARFQVIGGFLLAGVILFLCGCAAYGPPRVAGENVYRRIVFASPGGKDLKLDLYVPPKSGRPAPVVIWIFGGSWRFGSRGYHLNVRDLTQSGIAVAAIDYRFSHQAKYPAQLEDCQAALRWLEANGERFEVDANRIGVAGESSGGHLAALLGTMEGREKVKAVFAMYPVTDLVKIGRQYADANPSDIERLLGGPIEKILSLARAGSPVNHVSANSPPFLLIHGAKDALVPIDHSENLDLLLREAGVPSHLIVVPDKGHWFSLTRSQRIEVANFFLRALEQ